MTDGPAPLGRGAYQLAPVQHTARHPAMALLSPSLSLLSSLSLCPAPPPSSGFSRAPLPAPLRFVCRSLYIAN